MFKVNSRYNIKLDAQHKWSGHYISPLSIIEDTAGQESSPRLLKRPKEIKGILFRVSYIVPYIDLVPKIWANSVSSANRWQMKYLSWVGRAAGRVSPRRNFFQHFFLKSPRSLRPFLLLFPHDLGLAQKSVSFCVHLLCPDEKGINMPLCAHQTTGSPLLMSWACVQLVWTNLESDVS